MDDIRYVEHHSINKVLWDQTIEYAVNSLPYALSWYLDAVCGSRWDALILGDYEFIFPLPYSRVYKIAGPKKYLQPLFTQQLGIFSSDILGDQVINRFVEAIPSEFQLNFNERNKLGDTSYHFDVEERSNYLLDLSRTPDAIRQKYSKSLRKRLKKANTRHQLQLGQVTPRQLVDLYQKILNDKVGLKKRHYKKVLKLMKAAIQRDKGRIFSVLHESGQLGAVGFFLIHNGRIINLFGTSTTFGYEKFSMHALLDKVIAKHANQPGWLFDFEGSTIPSVAQFFASFGSKQRPYFKVENR